MDEKKLIDPGWKWDDRFVFSQAVQVGDTIYVSGQVALDPQGNVVGKGDMKAQTRQALENVKAVLAAAGATIDDVVRVTAYLTDMSKLMDSHEVRGEYFKNARPASTSVEVKSLAFPDLMIEIDIVAVKKG